MVRRATRACSLWAVCALCVALDLHAAPSWLSDPNRPWHVSLSVREEYSDNANTDDQKNGTFNTIVGPGLELALPMENTDLYVSYNYEATIYSDPPGQDDIEHSHYGNLSLSHRFNPRLSLEVSDALVRAVEPELVVDDGVSVIVRRRGDYWNNAAGATLTYGLTERWNLSLGGNWSIWRFDDSIQAQLNDRESYRVSPAVSYSINPRTAVGIEYSYSRTIYEDSRIFNLISTTNTPVAGTQGARNYDSHSPRLTLTRDVNPKLKLEMDGGFELIEYNDGSTDIFPAGSIRARYAYLPDGKLTAGFNYGATETEVASVQTAETASFFLKITHPITQKLRITVDGSFFWSQFETSDSVALTANDEQGMRVGVRFAYEITRWLFAEAGYTHDRVFSDLPGREFARNRSFIGARFTY